MQLAFHARNGPPMYELIELFFFAYRDFIGDADRLLEAYGFGRAHHRVLYFVSRRPGLTIAELLEILRITKQSLNRVLRELIDKNFVEIAGRSAGSATAAALRDPRRRALGADARAGAEPPICFCIEQTEWLGPGFGDRIPKGDDRSRRVDFKPDW